LYVCRFKYQKEKIMKSKHFLLAVLFFTVSLGISAQKEYNIEKVTVVNLGDGRMLFRDMETEKPLQGEHRLIDGYRSEYILANFKDGLYDGTYKHYKRNKLVEEKTYKEGIGNGIFKDYHIDGETVKSEREVKNGKVHGIARDYSQHGKLETEKGYDNGVEHGKELRYHYETGELTTDRNYVNGKLDGKQIEHISSNRADYLKISNYKMGVLDGDYSETLKEGDIIRTKGKYKNGKKEGKWITNRKEGIPEKEITYKDGEQDGETRIYYTDGTVEEVAMYAKGKREGLTKKYDYNTTKIKSEYNYKNGKKEGNYKLYFDDGKLREEGRCENDTQVYRKEYSNDGKVKSVKQKTRTGWETVE